jgi:hypothetical protein
MPSLLEIETSFCRLLQDSEARDAFLAGRGNGHVLPADIGQLDFDPKGVSLYAKLTNFAYQEVMPTVYPGCMQLIGDEWVDVVNDYLAKFPPRHFNLNQSTKEFPQYLAKFGKKFLEKYPFIVELADYEWIELQVMEDASAIVDGNYDPLTSAEQFSNSAPIVNPTLVIRSYNYPIPAIVDCLAADEPLDACGTNQANVAIGIFRHPENNLSKFLQLGEVAENVIEAAGKKPTSYKDLLAIVMAGASDANQAVLQFLELIETLQSLKLFVGSNSLA